MSNAFRRHIAHPCAWKAAELRRDASWIYELSPAEIAEIEILGEIELSLPSDGDGLLTAGIEGQDTADVIKIDAQ